MGVRAGTRTRPRRSRDVEDAVLFFFRAALEPLGGSSPGHGRSFHTHEPTQGSRAAKPRADFDHVPTMVELSLEEIEKIFMRK